MNAAIDVLAVMDEMIDCYGSVEECPDDTEFLVAAREARAAVAELIEAAKNFERVSLAFDNVNGAKAEARKRLRAAIACVGGAK